MMTARYHIGRFLLWLIKPAQLEAVRILPTDRDAVSTQEDNRRCIEFVEKRRARERAADARCAADLRAIRQRLEREDAL